MSKSDYKLMFLEGGGEVGKLMRGMEWNATVLKDPQGWPQSLRTAISILINSPIPALLFWGPDLMCFYNDASLNSLGIFGKHPHLLGSRVEDHSTEIWRAIKPKVEQVFVSGANTSEDLLIPIYQHGKTVNAYRTFSYNPVFNESGSPAGLLVSCYKTTSEDAHEDDGAGETDFINFTHPQEMVSTGLQSTQVNGQPGKNLTELSEKQLRRQIKEVLKMNQALKKSEERYHLMIEEVEDYAILYLNLDGIIENWNKGAEKIKGYKASEIIGKSFSVFYTDKDRTNNLHLQLLNHARKTGRAVQEGWRVRRDKTVFWASVVITAVHNEMGDVTGFSKVTHDLTGKKEIDDKLRIYASELKQKNADLESMNKDLQSFAFISSHDLQEPLRKIQTFATQILVKEYPSLSESGKDKFNRIQKAAQRLQTLIDDLLAYSRTTTDERNFEITHLVKIIDEIREELKEELQPIQLIIDVPETYLIRMVRFQFRQLLYNLISNSIKFSTKTGEPFIKIKSQIELGFYLDDARLDANIKYCHVAISDNGIGFDQQYSEKIFEVFQRLHGVGEYKGTGIGLAIVKKIVDNHNGFVSASGEPGKGATFNIYIPAVEE